MNSRTRNQRSVASILYVMLVVIGVAPLPACDADDVDGSDSAVGSTCDGGFCPFDGGPPAPPVEPKPDAGPDTGMGSHLMSCTSDEDCDDGDFCNGVETCTADDEDDAGAPGSCAPATQAPCGTQFCHEMTERCDCDLDADGLIAVDCGGDDCDADGDGYAAEGDACDGNDCDDANPDANKGLHEVCDDDGVDEDCDPSTLGGDSKTDLDADSDHDEAIDAKCCNPDPNTGDPVCGDDCDDENPAVSTEVPEVCDYIDNDCNGRIDEGEDAQGNVRERGLQRDYYRDADGDRWADKDEPPSSRCGRPEGYVARSSNEKWDCDDEDPDRHPEEPEVCDGKDNDCDGKIDTDDNDLEIPPSGNGHAVCDDGRLIIDQCPDGLLWCSDTVEFGCATDATRLSSCHECKTKCGFACGDTGCDEVDQLAAGSYHACARLQFGRVACWGRGADGQLGDDNTGGSSVPRQVYGIADAIEVEVGLSHSCAIAGEDKRVYCWGRNQSLQLGNEDGGAASSVPIAVNGLAGPRLTGAIKLGAGDEHTCAVLESGEVACWGQTANGRLASSESVAGRRGVDLALGTGYSTITDAADIVSGARHSCILTHGGTVACWGDNSQGQLGRHGDEMDPTIAEPVVGLSEVTLLTAGREHTCALSAGSVFCWGADGSLQLGRPSDTSDDVPLPVAELSNVDSIAAGDWSTCAVLQNRSVVCWGSNTAGERGDADPTPTAMPMSLDLSSVAKISAGAFVCARLDHGQVYCWGPNVFGQLGAGSGVSEASTPLAIKPLFGSKL